MMVHQFIDRAFNLSNDLLDRIRWANGFVDFMHRLLRKVHDRSHDIVRFEIHTDETSAFRIERQQCRWPPVIALGFLSLEKKTLGDQAVHVSAYGGWSEMKLPRQINARESLVRAH